MKNFKKIVVAFLIVALVVSIIPFSGGVKAAEYQTVKIFASKIKSDKSKYYSYDASNPAKPSLTINDLEVNIEFVIDEDIELYSISSRNNHTLTISGEKKLTVSYNFKHDGSYVQETGSNVFVGPSGLIVVGSANIKTGATLTLDSGDDDTYEYPIFFVVQELNISGNVTCNSNSYGIYAYLDINITGGNVNSTAMWGPIASQRCNVNISGGNIYLHALGSSALIAEDTINISGGYIEAKLDSKENDNESYLCTFTSKNGLNISSPMYIKSPEGCSAVKDEESSYYTIVNSNGNYPLEVIIADKAAEEAAQKAAEEAAAQKAAEEAAAQKAAEEAAAKKTAEEAAQKAGQESGKKSSGDTANNTSGNSTGGSTSNATDASADNKSTYSNEWVNGQWYGNDGDNSYTAQGSWKSDSKGWWFEDTSGWYPQSQWQKIDGKWYYFTSDGYMDYSEYRDGCWLGSDGAWVEDFAGGTWHKDSKGWWFEDNGWYPNNQYLWINGSKYWFDASGYLKD
ncbi:MAG: hypothetical protein ILA13_09085 [Eubacterium sp.]|nr:hypothetical protein [Eubacterium sp.]